MAQIQYNRYFEKEDLWRSAVLVDLKRGVIMEGRSQGETIRKENVTRNDAERYLALHKLEPVRS